MLPDACYGHQFCSGTCAAHPCKFAEKGGLLDFFGTSEVPLPPSPRPNVPIALHRRLLCHSEGSPWPSPTSPSSPSARFGSSEQSPCCGSFAHHGVMRPSEFLATCAAPRRVVRRADLLCGNPAFNCSASIFRSRWNKVFAHLGICTDERRKGIPPKSLRGSGASWLFHHTESLERVLWRGRWQSRRSLEHYLQDVMGQFLLSELPQDKRDAVCSLAEASAHLLLSVVDGMVCNPLSRC